MKRISVLLFVACLVLSACSQRPAPTPEPAPAPEPEPSSAIGMPNPMVSTASANYENFSLVGYPDDEEVSPKGYWLIAGEIAQLDYEIEGQSLVFRAAKDTGEDISGVYETFEEDGEQEMTLSDGSTVTVRFRATATGPALATWTRGGYTFSMYMPHSPMGMAGGLLPRFLETEAVEN